MNTATLNSFSAKRMERKQTKPSHRGPHKRTIPHVDFAFAPLGPIPHAARPWGRGDLVIYNRAVGRARKMRELTIVSCIIIKYGKLSGILFIFWTPVSLQPASAPRTWNVASTQSCPNESRSTIRCSGWNIPFFLGKKIPNSGILKSDLIQEFLI